MQLGAPELRRNLNHQKTKIQTQKAGAKCIDFPHTPARFYPGALATGMGI